MNEAYQGVERRAPRRRVLLTALVVYANFSVSFRCMIRDRSDRGARLKLPDSLVVPPEFWLIEVNEGRAYPAQAAWRRYPEVGVSLGEPISLEHPGLDADQRRLRALWIEVAPRR